ncbi:hypothetical protein EDC94DRAFT_650960 [Helicostylum pulchrum]|nr:hypothetical protein EDC94DRAFT_650960 [Helicostylum pulchrum]
MLNDNQKETSFLVTNASGRHINILNDNEAREAVVVVEQPSPPSSEISDETSTEGFLSSSSSKRKYHCSEPGCPKSFTTSGHLARHNRIHTGEKNFPCLFPGCQSRFSRQDNMMQHYRTHMSPKSRRTQKKIISEDLHPRPRLHAHQRIRSDPYRVERPLTIDQHLNNYRRSLLSHPSTADRVASSVKYNMPTPLGSVAASHMQKQQQQKNWVIEPIGHQSSNSSHHEDEEDDDEEDLLTTPPVPEIIFYQHKPLTFSSEIKKSSLPFTLLHPSQVQQTLAAPQVVQPASYQFEQTKENTPPPLTTSSTSSSTTTNDSHSSSQAGLLQLAHIVSTFG